MSNAGRWTIVVLVLAVAGIVALWPGADDASQPRTEQRTLGSPRPAPAEGDAVLAPLRERATLQPCPSPERNAPAPSGPLAGVRVACLGAPGTVDLGTALAGKTTLLNLWASWCGPCREEMPVLARYAKRPDSVDVLGVTVQDRASSALEFMAEVGVNYPSLYDGDRRVQRALRIPPLLPVNYLVRPDGSVVRITNPPVFHSPEEVQAAVERYRRADP
ncbi:thiol-disulfide isomerase [Saccharomonospora sp. CUA-673]|uniref:TlpA family protein disulfide reductase n=1 Tax=Saccharomonospora sp. CUA-673 TaxID=1904969 RepID=UPI0009600F2F|nr:TlpA disulfide reductase family protein [Saccharomonospora sp. CUA-673]OLT41765.1 thiol-disulfide isomerase [Saccharomonospora sp. CUA-673]